jgi:hypothetical protein
VAEVDGESSIAVGDESGGVRADHVPIERSHGKDYRGAVLSTDHQQPGFPCDFAWV